jgi:hypothetical protein
VKERGDASLSRVLAGYCHANEILQQEKCRPDDGQPDLPSGDQCHMPTCPVAASSITWCDSGP